MSFHCGLYHTLGLYLSASHTMRLIWFRPVPGDSVVQFVGLCVKRTETGKERVIPRTERGKEGEE